MSAALTMAGDSMRAIADLAPWHVTPLGESPFVGYWCFNPSVIRTSDGRWLCSVRCSNYHMPGSTHALRPKAVTKIHNRNLMIELDPGTLAPRKIYEISDRTGDANKGMWSGAGFEDLRLVQSGETIYAIAAAMRPDTEAGGVTEIVLLELGSSPDDRYQIVRATPLRGTWSNQHQKNWSPFADSFPLQILYSPLDGGVHNLSGRTIPTHLPMTLGLDGLALPVAEPSELDPAEALPASVKHGAIEIQLSRRVAPIPGHIKPPAQKTPSATRLALRGGTQLIAIPGRDTWIGLAHGCRVDRGRKNYWHQLYEIDGAGALHALSEPFKLDPTVGIEFAAGLAADVDADRAVISFGLEDDRAVVGETTFSALLGMLRPLGAPMPMPMRSPSPMSAATPTLAMIIEALERRVRVLEDRILKRDGHGTS